MKKTLIVFEDGKKDLEAVAQLLAASLNSQDPKDREVKVRAASLVTISELLAATDYFFGADSLSLAPFRELARIFSGINLAGRTAAFFGGSEKALGALKASLGDTEVRIHTPDLHSGPLEPSAVAAWLKSLS